jgi:hypothetical protein
MGLMNPALQINLSGPADLAGIISVKGGLHLPFYVFGGIQHLQ